MKKIFFFIILITILSVGQALSMECKLEVRSPDIIAAECHEIKTGQFNTTKPIINVTFNEEGVDVFSYEVRRLGDLDYDLEGLDENEDYFQEFNDYSPYNLNRISSNKFQPIGILSDGVYAFKLVAFNEPNIYLDVVVLFQVNASQMNFWVKSPANHSIPKPDFTASSIRINNLTIETERPVEGCRYGFGLPDASRQELYDFSYSSNVFELLNPTTLMIENFDFDNSSAFTSEESSHGFKFFHVVCKEESVQGVSAKYSYKRLHMVYLANSPSINPIQANPSIIKDANNPSSILNITTSQTSACYLEIEDENLQTNQIPRYNYDSNFIFNKITFYQKNNLQNINFSLNPAEYEYVFNVTCANLANLSTTVTQTIKTDFTSSFKFKFITPSGYSNIKDINVSGAYTTPNQNCIAKFNDEVEEYPLQYKSLITQGPNTGDSLYQAIIKKPTFTDGRHTIHVRCAGMPHGLYDSTSFTLDTKKPTNMTITTGANSCSLTEIKATLSAQDENGIDYYEYKLEYKGKLSDDLDKEDTTSSSLRIRIPNGLENETFELSVTPVDRAGNKGDTVKKTIKITDSKMIECDTTPPRIKITPEYLDLLNHWKINVSCADQDSGCKQSFVWGSNTNTSDICKPEKTHSLNDLVTVTQAGLFCAEVYDLNENKASDTITLNRTLDSACGELCGIPGCPPCQLGDSCTEDKQCLTNYCKDGSCANSSCVDGIQNGFETGVDCGGPHCDKCPIGKGCNNDVDCDSGNCIEGICEASSCTNNKLDGKETDIDCGGPDCDACTLGKRCKTINDCTEGECIGGRCTIPAEPPEPEKEGPSTLGLIMLIAGVLSISGGGVLLYMEDDKKKVYAKTEEANKMKTALNSGIPRVTNLDDNKQPQIKQLSPQEIAMRKEAWEKSLKEKDQKRKQLLDNFEEEKENKPEDEEIKDEKEKNTKSGTENKKETKKLDQGQTDEYVELGVLKNKDDVFEKLKTTNKKTTKKAKIQQGTKENKIKKTTQTKPKTEDEDDFFEKLKEMNKKKKTKK